MDRLRNGTVTLTACYYGLGHLIGAVAFSKGMKPPCEDMAESELEIKHPNLTLLHLSHLLMISPLSKLRKPKCKGDIHARLPKTIDIFGMEDPFLIYQCSIVNPARKC